VHRQAKQTKVTNQELFGQAQKLRVERSRLAAEQPTSREIQMKLEAASFLGLNAYQRFISKLERGLSDYSVTIVNDPVTSECIRTVVQSRRYPDATPRVFLNGCKDRCACNDRVAEQEMCVHEIMVFGFQKQLYLPRHARRDSVQGSLEGWEPHKSRIDSLIGFEGEELDNYHDSTAVGYQRLTSSSDDETEITTANNNFQLSTTTPPSWYIRNSSISVEPMRSKEVGSIIITVKDSYHRCSREQQFQICDLALQMQNVLIDGKAGKSVSDPKHRGELFVPTGQTRLKESKNRLMKASEIARKKVKSKVSSKIQKLGMQQVVQGTQFDVQVNPTKKEIHCSFCGDNHTVNSCEPRKQLCQIGHEYALSTKTPVVRQALKQRIQCMPFAPYGGGTPMGNLPTQCIRANMIIEQASQTPANTIVFCATFLGSNASPMNDYHHLWITNDALDTCVNTQTVKVKYIYDQTIVHKDGWLSRSQHSTQSHLGVQEVDFGIGWTSGRDGDETNGNVESIELNEDGDSRSGESNKNEFYDSSSDDDGTTLKQLREDYEAREGKIEQI
jgi:hypothetical protein